MRRCVGFLAVPTAILLLSTTPAPAAGTYMNSVRSEALLQAQRLLLNDRFSTVDSLYNSYIQTYPDDPAGYFFKAAALMGEMADQEENLYPGLFNRLLDTVEALAIRPLDTADGHTRAWMYLILGHARAYRSLWESRFGSLLAAIKLGFSAKSAYNEGLKADSSLYDLYLGLGSYHYWKSARGGLLRWLGILRNERDKGIAELQLAADSSLLSKEAAQSALVWIWLDRKAYDSAIGICRALLQTHEDSKSLLWPLATAYYKTKDYQSALIIYRQLRERIAERPGNYYNLIECDHYISRCLEKLDRTEDARQQARRITAYYEAVPEQTRSRQRTKTVYLLRLAKE